MLAEQTTGVDYTTTVSYIMIPTISHVLTNTLKVTRSVGKAGVTQTTYSPLGRFLDKCPASWTTSHNEKTSTSHSKSGHFSNGSSMPAVISKNWSSTVMTWSNGNIFRVCWGFVRGIHRWPVDFPSQNPVTQNFDVFFDVRLNKLVTNSRHAGDLRSHGAHCDVNLFIDLVCAYVQIRHLKNLENSMHILEWHSRYRQSTS